MKVPKEIEEQVWCFYNFILTVGLLAVPFLKNLCVCDLCVCDVCLGLQYASLTYQNLPLNKSHTSV